MSSSTSAAVACKACGHHFTGKYCNQCGEKVYTDHDRTVGHFVEEGVHFFTHFEGTFFTTLKYIFTRPGKLSEDYCYGKRKSLFKPMSLFFLLVIIYLLFPVFEGLNMKLYYHTNGSVYAGFAKREALAVAQHHGWTDAQLSDAFHEKSAKVSKFMLLVLLPLTALFFWAFTFKQRPFFFDQMVLATEVNSMYLIWGYLLLPLVLTVFLFVYRVLGGQGLSFNDNVIGPLIILPLCAYVAAASHRFYKLSWAKAIGLALLFLLANYVIVQVIYKFLLLVVSLKLLR